MTSAFGVVAFAMALLILALVAAFVIRSGMADLTANILP